MGNNSTPKNWDKTVSRTAQGTSSDHEKSKKEQWQNIAGLAP